MVRERERVSVLEVSDAFIAHDLHDWGGGGGCMPFINEVDQSQPLRSASL